MLATRLKGTFSSSSGEAGFGYSYLGQRTAISSTSTTYSSFSSSFSSLTPQNNITIVAVLQSRNSNGDQSSPYSSVTIGGTSATIINRAYSRGTNDYNSSAIAYISGFNLSSSVTVNVSLSDTHEGQANVFLYAINQPTSATSSDNVGTGAIVSTTTTTPSGSFVTIASANTSNSSTAHTISTNNGTITEDDSKDGGTTEWVTVASSEDIPSGTSVTFSSSGNAASGAVAILVGFFQA
jgi:hypothetical protein